MEPRGSLHPFAPLRVLLPLLLFALPDAAQIEPSNVSDWVQRVKQPEYQKWLALTALHYFNYRSALPTRLRLLHTVTSSTGFVNGEKNFGAGVAFTAGSYHMTNEKKYTGDCLSSVTFKSKVLAPDVIVSCQSLMNKLEGDQNDYLLFKNLSKTLPIPGQLVTIPVAEQRGGIMRPVPCATWWRDGSCGLACMLALGSCVVASGSCVLASGSSVLASGSCVLASGSCVVASGFCMLASASCGLRGCGAAGAVRRVVWAQLAGWLFNQVETAAPCLASHLLAIPAGFSEFARASGNHRVVQR